MRGSTVFFGALTLILALLTAGVVGFVWQSSDNRADVLGVQSGSREAPLGLAPGTRKEDSEIRAESALLWDMNTQEILYEQNSFERRPIASLTKLMTAMIALDFGIDWEKEAEILRDEYTVGSKLWLYPGERVTMRDLFYTSLMGSANNATIAYVRELGVEEDEFVRAMNRKAVELGLEQTQFTDVTGLETGNVSTAYEIARMMEVVLKQYPDIAEVTSRKEYTFSVRGSEREKTILNSNWLVSREDWEISGGKTGFLYEAGWCLVTAGSGAKEGKIGVVLGGESESSHFVEMKRLLKW